MVLRRKRKATLPKSHTVHSLVLYRVMFIFMSAEVTVGLIFCLLAEQH